MHWIQLRLCLHSVYIPKRICQFMVKACCVAATNDVPVHMSARRAISPTLSPIQTFWLLLCSFFKKTHAERRGCFNLMRANFIQAWNQYSKWNKVLWMFDRLITSFEKNKALEMNQFTMMILTVPYYKNLVQEICCLCLYCCLGFPVHLLCKL